MVLRHEQLANVVVGQHCADDHPYRCVSPGDFYFDASVSCL